LHRIDSVAISIPTIVGPYSTVNCTLTLEESWTREVASEEVTSDSLLGLPESIITSSAREDSMPSGDPRDDRRRPFHGRGAISRWRIDLPPADNSFPLSLVSDVILHVRYTARGSAERVEAAREARHLALPGASIALTDDGPPLADPDGNGRALFLLRSEF